MTIIIKKYANRKLYDIQNSRYCKLNDIINYTKCGYDVIVFDHRTNTDVTTSVLQQCLLKRKKTISELKHLVMIS